MWKIQNVSINKISCEISLRNSRSAKAAILTHLEAVNLDFYEFLHFLKAEIQPNPNFGAPEIAKSHKKPKSRASRIAKTADLELLESPKLISCKI